MLEAAPPSLESLKEPVRARLGAVREEIVRMVSADFPTIREVGDHLLASEGKLLRPTLLLLANGVGGRPDAVAVKLAALVELLHVATLVHDDAVDHSATRRGMPTVNARWTHQVAIIMGDFLYSRAVIEITRLGELEWIEILATSANRMTVGEMRQLVMHDALDFTEEQYRRLCRSKTASLMSAACELGALAGDPSCREALRDFGDAFGMAFQVTDDLLDYTAREEQTGKPVGLDLEQHKVTLPLIAALPRMSASERARVEALFENPEPADEEVEAVTAIVAELGGLHHAKRKARGYAERARECLEGLPEDSCTEALRRAVDYVVERGR